MCTIPMWMKAAGIEGRDGGKAAKDDLTRLSGWVLEKDNRERLVRAHQVLET